jgi:hypothetical protein
VGQGLAILDSVKKATNSPVPDTERSPDTDRAEDPRAISS